MNTTIFFHNNGLKNVTENSVSVGNYILAFIYAICIILVYTGNTMTVIAIAKFEALRTPSNSFIMSLSMADITVGIATPAYVTINYLKISLEPQTEKWLCIVTICTIVFSGELSLYSLLCISIDRFIAVFYPFNHAEWLCQKRVNVIISCMWAWFLGVASLPLFGIHQWKEGIECTYVKFHHRIYLLYILGPFVGLGLFFSQFFYCLIFYKAWKQRRQIAAQAVQLTASNEEKKREKQAKLMAFVLAIFLLCWLPYTLFNALIGMMGNSAPKDIEVLMEISKVIVFCNSFINPLIYGWKSMEFRKAYFKILGCNPSRLREKDFVKTRGFTTVIHDG